MNQEVNHDVVAIVNDLGTRLKRSTRRHTGASLEIYKFIKKQHAPAAGWKHGRVLRASRRTDLLCPATREIEAKNGLYESEALFLIHEPDALEMVEDMMVRSSTIRHMGMLKPRVAGFNTQLSRPISGFNGPTPLRLTEWMLNLKTEEVQQMSEPSEDIPYEVKQAIRTYYLSIENLWKKGSTSDGLDNVENYHMIDNHAKINPLCTRRRTEEENDIMPLRHAFGEMIQNNIYSLWEDDEVVDFIELLNLPKAIETIDVLEQPFLLVPNRRELKYQEFDRDKNVLTANQRQWLVDNADPGAGWQTRATSVDPTFGKIIIFQAEQVAANQGVDQQGAGQHGGGQQAAGQPAAGQPNVGFTHDFSGALHFANVCTSHYLKHYKATAEGDWRRSIKGRVDAKLKKALPGLLTKRYNVNYVDF